MILFHSPDFPSNYYAVRCLLFWLGRGVEHSLYAAFQIHIHNSAQDWFEPFSHAILRCSVYAGYTRVLVLSFVGSGPCYEMDASKFVFPWTLIRPTHG
jgi:hypothetical protein